MEIKDLNLREIIEQETGQIFDRHMKIHSPFNINDKTPSFVIHYDSNADKWKWRDFSADKSGDVIDFIMQYKGMSYTEARTYLGIPLEKTEFETDIEKIEGYINWSIKNQDFRKGQELLGIFPYTNEENKVEYYKAKFRKEDGKKELAYFHIENGKVKNGRGLDHEIPYNLYRTLKGIEEGRTVIFLEGEKDVNLINSMIGPGYVATSIKNCKKEGILLIKKCGMKIIVIGDNDEPGKKYLNTVMNYFIDSAAEYRQVKLPYIDLLGKGADISDWIQIGGHTKEELLNVFWRTLDLKDKFEIQQDSTGCYKKVFKETKDGIDEKRIQLTNFVVLEAKRLIYNSTGEEGIYLKLKSSTGAVVEKQGQIQIFDDVKSFRNFLGSLDLTFLAKLEDLQEFKVWLNQYFATENEELYDGATFKKINNKLTLIASDTAINGNSIVNGIKAESTDLSVADKEEISKEELNELCSRLFKFSNNENTIPIIGSIINNLMVDCCIENNIFLHHLLLVGESGSGKSAILNNVVVPILGLDINDVKSLGESTNAAITMAENQGNYPIIFDEYKPSTFNDYKKQFLSNFLRNVYGRTKGEKGNKNFENRIFTKNRPWILAGEESYSNNEKANIERSCIVYISKGERTKEHEEAFEWIKNNQDIMRKFGFSILKTVLELDYDLYMDIRELEEKEFADLKDRPKNTAINVAAGIEIFNILLEKHGMPTLKNYEQFILKNISEEVLEDGEETRSAAEQMLILYNSMIEDGRAVNWDEVIRIIDDHIYIRTSEMVNQLCAFKNSIKSAEIILLGLKDFKKQAKKAGYIIGMSTKQLTIASEFGKSRNVRFDEYDLNMIRKLNLNMFLKDIEFKEGKIINFN